MTEFANSVFLNKLGDEYHYLFECNYFEDQRRMYPHSVLTSHHNTFKFRTFISTKELPLLFKLGKFCKEILRIFKVIYSTNA